MQKDELKKPYPLINIDKKFILFTNAKCGGTTLKNWFVDSLELDRTFSNPFKAIQNYGIFFVGQWYRSNLLIHDVNQIKSSNSLLRRFIRIYRNKSVNSIIDNIDNTAFTTFAVIRNPYDRLVSGFVDKFCGKDRRLKWVRDVLAEVNSLDEEGNPSITFRQFVDYLSNHELSEVDAHWRHQWHVLEQTKIDHMIDLKSMSTDLPKLSEQLGVKMRIDLTKRRQSNTYDKDHYAEIDHIFDVPNTKLIMYKREFGGFPGKNAFYTDALRNNVYDIYKIDFDNLGYSK